MAGDAQAHVGGLDEERAQLLAWKRLGFSDKRLGALMGIGEKEVRQRRLPAGVRAVYKRDREDLRGLAELILAKQRNGPVGKVDLVFLHNLTKFENRAEDLGDVE